MRLEHYSERRLKAEILKIVGKYLDLKRYKVFFFGSRVRGTSSERSDIDVGIRGCRKIPGSVMAEIKEDIDNLPTLYRFDVVDFGHAAPGFRSAAFRDIEYVN
jgi:predicted nucleotidyltransferase